MSEILSEPLKTVNPYGDVLRGVTRKKKKKKVPSLDLKRKMRLDFVNVALQRGWLASNRLYWFPHRPIHTNTL